MKYMLWLIATIYPPTVAAEPAPFQFGSIAKGEANVRTGPGTQYPIVWVYQRRGLPVEVLASYFHWYQIRDSEGEEGWVYKSLLSRKRTILTGEGPDIPFYRKPDHLEVRAYVKPGVIAELIACNHTLCEVKLKNTNGWLPKERLMMLSDHD